MVFDRTQEDVNMASEIRDAKVKNFLPLTDEDVGYLEKGSITINTLNRIEQKQEELRGIFNDMGYWNTQIVNKTWNYIDVFNETEFQRIVYNDRILRAAFLVYKGTPKTPAPIYHYENINALEKILFDLDEMIDDIKSRYRRCGTFNCGEK